MLFVILSAIFITTTDVALGSFQFRPEINRWIKYNRIVATWESAVQNCLREGAVLASPLNKEHLYELQTYFGDTSFYIGAHARYNTNMFHSFEGVPLDAMPLDGMYDSLDTDNGRCLIMNNHSISAVPCTTRHPYACYRKQNDDMELNKCGTNNGGYVYEESTASCYKCHYQLKDWETASATCTAEGAYLAIINNADEAKVILKNINYSSRYMFLGLRDWFGEGTWMSIYGEPVEQMFNVWEDGNKPNDSSDDRCAALHPSTAEYKDFECSVKAYFVCEKDALNKYKT